LIRSWRSGRDPRRHLHELQRPRGAPLRVHRIFLDDRDVDDRRRQPRRDQIEQARVVVGEAVRRRAVERENRHERLARDERDRQARAQRTHDVDRADAQVERGIAVHDRLPRQRDRAGDPRAHRTADAADGLGVIARREPHRHAAVLIVDQEHRHRVAGDVVAKDHPEQAAHVRQPRVAAKRAREARDGQQSVGFLIGKAFHGRTTLWMTVVPVAQ